MSGMPWPSGDAGSSHGGDQQVLLPPAPTREDRSQRREQALRKIAWSKAISEYLRGDCQYQWIPIDQVLRYFEISRSVLDGVINERMTVRSVSREVDGVTLVTEEIKGNRSTRSTTGSTWRSRQSE
jgi:hypothetical protein